MSDCPFCRQKMEPAESGGLPHEACGGCGAMWLEGTVLARVVGTGVTEKLVQRAKGRAGQCKHCEEPVQYVPGCPRCGAAAARCPQCGEAPLAVVEVSKVPLEVCSRGHGVGLDAGELEQLQRAADAVRSESREGAPTLAPPARPRSRSQSSVVCAGCGRKLNARHAFEADGQMWCGSCAPVGATPVVAELTSSTPRVGMYDVPSRGLRNGPGLDGSLLGFFRSLLDD